LAGAGLTAVHTLILEIYYQWLAPVGLPQEPEWLDFNHFWVTGIPAHFLAILAGYLLALWLWKRNRPVEEVDWAETANFALYALITAVIILFLDGLITQLIFLQDFPGITFFVQHLLIAFVFVAAWTAYSGFSTSSLIVGSLMLALVWVTYNMYLGPRGLPLEPPVYSGYDDLWWKSFRGAFFSALIGWWVSGKFILNRLWAQQPQAAVERGTNALHATASASGEAMRVTGPDPVNMNSTAPAEGSISVETWESGNRWSHIQNTDAMAVKAEFSTDEGKYEVTIDRPMPRHPLGKYTTWNGVVYDHEMHGDTGIGTGKLPQMRPEIAVWGWAVVKRGGKVLSPMAPAHVMVTSSGPMPGIMLEVDTEEKTLSGAPDGYINVMWPRIGSLQMPESHSNLRLIVGWIALIGIVLLFGVLAWREPPLRRRR
jgi:hypothetical protein